MTGINKSHRVVGLSLRQAAVVAGISYFLMPVAFADFYIFPKLIVSGDIAHTVQNVASHEKLFFVGIVCHFITLVLDVIIAWALYALLAPVNQALSLLTAFFRLVYAANYLAGLSTLITALHIITFLITEPSSGTSNWMHRSSFYSVRSTQVWLYSVDFGSYSGGSWGGLDREQLARLSFS